MTTIAPRLHIVVSPFAVPVDEAGFIAWLAACKHGDTIAYYRGHLAHDRMPSTGMLSKAARAALHAVAHRVFVAHDQGLVIPVQKRVGNHEWLYIAIRSDRPSIARPASAGARGPASYGGAAFGSAPDRRMAA